MEITSKEILPRLAGVNVAQADEELLLPSRHRYRNRAEKLSKTVGEEELLADSEATREKSPQRNIMRN